MVLASVPGDTVHSLLPTLDIVPLTLALDAWLWLWLPLALETRSHDAWHS